MSRTPWRNRKKTALFRNRSRRRRLAIEMLEDRRLLTGDATSWLYWLEDGVVSRSFLDGTSITPIVQSSEAGWKITNFDVDTRKNRIYFAEQKEATHSRIRSVDLLGQDPILVSQGVAGKGNYSMAVDSLNEAIYLHSHDAPPISNFGPIFDGRIQKIKYDGTFSMLPPILFYVHDMEVDPEGNTLYYTNSVNSEGLFKSDLNGVGSSNLSPDYGDMRNVAISFLRNKLIYSVVGETAGKSTIYTMNLDGSGKTKLGDYTGAGVDDIEIDDEAGVIYFATTLDGIFRTSLSSFAPVRVLPGQKGEIELVKIPNTTPTLNPINDLTINEDAGLQTVNLTGITAGVGESQPLRITVASSNASLIPTPSVSYTSPNSTGAISFAPLSNKWGASTITVTVEDGGPDGDLSTTADNATFSRSFTVTVAPVNDAPSLDASASPTLGSVLEGALDPIGITVAELIVDGSITDPDGSAVEAIAITGLNTHFGSWQYKLDGVSNWKTIDAMLINSQTNELALLLGATARLRLVPFGYLNGSASDAITFRAWDRSIGVEGKNVIISETGGGSAFSVAVDTASLNVMAVNDAPIFWNGDGKITTDFGFGEDVGSSIAIQPDGRILMGGYSWNGSNFDFALSRYHANGSLDSSFGSAGKVTTPIGGGGDVGQVVKVQADGKIVVCGYVQGGNNDFALVRYNADGTLDTTFGAGGKVTTAIGPGNENGYHLMIQPDGMILVAGFSFNGSNDDFALVRYNSNGSLDTEFGVGGKVTTGIGSSDEGSSSLALQPDGKIVVGGSSYNSSTDYDFALIRYNSNGSLDTGFGNGGKVTTTIGTNEDKGYDVKVQLDGKILLGGWSRNPSKTKNDFALLRYNSNGSPDSSFGTDGKVTTAIGPFEDVGWSIEVQPDNKILLGGYSWSGSKWDLALVRYQANGALDTGFGSGGKVTTAIGTGRDIGMSLVLQTDGKILLGGFSFNGVDDDFAFVRYNANGSLDAALNPVNSLGGNLAYTENGDPIVLDSDVGIIDADLSAANNFGGATLTLVRAGGPSAEDQFSAVGTLGDFSPGGNLVVGGTTIGTVTNNAGGRLVVTFNSDATNSLVNSAMRQIAYANSSDSPTNSVVIEWIFSDGNNGTQGTGGPLNVTGSVTVTITAVNDSPSDLSLSSASLAENSGVNALVGVLSTTDADAGDTFTYTLVSGAGDIDNGAFHISGNMIRTVGDFNFENKSIYTVRVRSTDQGGLFTDKTFTISVTNVNEAPADIALSSTSIAENAGANAVVGALSTTDVDAGNTFTYTLVTGTGDTDNGAFHISGNSLRATSSFNFETKPSYTIRIRSTDQGGLFTEKTFAITVTNVNEAPTDISLSASSIAENAGANAVVGTLTTTDVDAGDTFTYTLVTGTGDTDNGAFNISGSTLRATSSFDFETKPSYTVRIRSTDQGGLFTEKIFTIAVTDVVVGDLDNNFDGDGKVTTAFGNQEYASSVAIQSDGKIVVAGSSCNRSNPDFALARYNSDGSLDTTFDFDGKVTTDFGNSDNYAFAVAIQGDGKIVVAGRSWNGNLWDFALARYNSDGSLDTTFDFDGKVTTDFGNSHDEVRSVAIQGDGKIVVAGSSWNGSNGDFALARYNSNGSLDTTFDGDGKVTMDFGNSGDEARSIAIQSDGKIVVAGYSLNGSNSDFAIARFISNGSLDITFDGDGKVMTDFEKAIDFAYSLAIQSDGKIVVAGVSSNSSNSDFALARYDSNGSLDTTFDGDGNVMTDFGNSGDFAYSVAIQSDGKIVVAGYSLNGSTYDFALARYNSNGSLDTIFGTDGKVTTDFGNSGDFAYSVAIQSDGKIVVAGESGFAIARYNSDINQNPTDIALSANSIAENAGANSTLGTLSTTDPDAGNTFAYTLVAGVGDTDNSAFNISGSNLRATSSFDFETKSSYSIRVRSTDQGGLFTEKTFTISVTNVNEAPTDFALSSSSIAENAANAVVGTLTTNDVDAGDTFTYTLVTGTGDTDNGAFNISGSNLRATSSFDFETKPSYTIRIRSTDQGGLFTEKTFAITVTNVNEAPTDIALSATSIAENAGANAVVGALSTTDVDAGNTFTYTLVAGTGDADNGAFNINGSNLRATSSFDFETKSSYTVRIRSTDQGGLFTEKTFTITVTNVNETPTDIGLSSSSIAENAGANAVVGALSTTDPDASNTFTYSLVTGAGDADNGSFNIIGSNLRATSSFDFETKSSYTVRVRSTDQGGLFTEKTFAITVTNVNETPTDIGLSSSSIAENAGANAVVGALSTTDPDAGNTFTYSLVTGAGDADNGSFNIIGSNLRATSSFDFETKSSYTVRVRSTDQGGLFTEKTFAITVTNVNETPTDIGLSASSIAENAGANAVVGALSTTDVDAGNTFTYSLVTGAGDADNGSFNINGSNLRATSSFDFETKSSYTVRIRSTDQGGLFTEKTFTISVTNVNEAPTDIALSSSSIAENAGANAVVGALSTTDVDAGNTFTYTLVAGTGDTDNGAFNINGNNLRATSSFDFETKSSYTVRVRSTDQGGLFTEKSFAITVTNVNETPTDIGLSSTSIAENAGASAVVGALSTTDVDAGNTFTYSLVTGAGDADNGSFNISGNSLRATDSFNFETKSSYTIRIRSTDQGGLFIEKAFTITVTNVNEAPTDIGLSSSSIAENAGANAVVGALSTTDVDAGNTFTYTLVAGTGDADNGAFNINGSNLRATSSFDFETKSSYTVRIRSTDQGGLFTEKTFTISVTNVNEAPTDITLSSSSIAENAGANAVVGALSTTDVDAGNTFTYTLVAGTGDADNGAFNINGSNLRATSSFDFETKSSYTVRIRSTDQGGLFTEKTFTISVTNVNEAPTDIALSSSSIAENAGANAVVGALSTTDVDAGNTFTYTLVPGTGDTDNGAFNINGSNLRATDSFDFETKSSYTVRIRSTDQEGLVIEKTFVITVTDVNEAPTDIGLSSSSIAENAGANAVVGALSTTNPDGGNTFAYSLVTGAGDSDNGSFSISGNSLRATSSFDFETKSSYTIRVRSTDQGGLFTEKSFAITVTNVNETPTDIGLSSTSIAENAGASAVVGALSTTDVDAGNTFTYSLVTGAGDADNGSFNISGNSLRATDSFNFETKSSYTIRIRSTDQGGLFIEKAFTITVTNVNEAPTDIGLSSSSIAENAGANAVVGALSTTDVDAGNTFTYTLVAGTGDTDNGAFNINGSNLRATGSFDFETKSSYTIRVRSTDQSAHFVEKTFTIQVIDVNESPTDINLTSTTIPENAGTNASVGTLSTADLDAGNTFVYALVAGPGDTDNAAFHVSSSTLRASSSFDFETRTDYTVRVRSTDQGGLFVEKAFTIRVVNANDAPVAVADSYWVSVGTFQILDVLANDSDTDGAIDPTSIEIAQPPLHGTATPLPDGTVRYTPNAGYRGAESFTYRVRDSLGLFSNEATVQLRVNSAPNTTADSLVAKQTIATVLDVLRNDNDPDGSLDPATLMVVSGPDMADVVVQADGTILFTPRAGFLGSTQFRYVVSDNEGRPSAPTDVTVLVVVSIYQNPRNRFDVDNDKTVSPLDVLLLVNLLNVVGPSLPVDGLPGPPPYVDVNGDNLVSPLDVLEVINYINSGGRSGGEGEGGAGRTDSSMPLGETVFDTDPGSAYNASLLSLDEYFERLGRERSFGVRSRRS